MLFSISVSVQICTHSRNLCGVRISKVTIYVAMSEFESEPRYI